VVIEDEDQVASPVEVRDQRRDAAGEVREDNQPVLIFEHPFEHRRVGFFETHPVHRKPLALECPGQNGARAEPVGVVVVQHLDVAVGPAFDVPNRPVHGAEEVFEH